MECLQKEREFENAVDTEGDDVIDVTATSDDQATTATTVPIARLFGFAKPKKKNKIVRHEPEKKRTRIRSFGTSPPR